MLHGAGGTRHGVVETHIAVLLPLQPSKTTTPKEYITGAQQLCTPCIGAAGVSDMLAVGAVVLALSSLLALIDIPGPGKAWGHSQGLHSFLALWAAARGHWAATDACSRPSQTIPRACVCCRERTHHMWMWPCRQSILSLHHMQGQSEPFAFSLAVHLFGPFSRQPPPLNTLLIDLLPKRFN